MQKVQLVGMSKRFPNFVIEYGDFVIDLSGPGSYMAISNVSGQSTFRPFESIPGASSLCIADGESILELQKQSRSIIQQLIFDQILTINAILIILSGTKRDAVGDIWLISKRKLDFLNLSTPLKQSVQVLWTLLGWRNETSQVESFMISCFLTQIEFTQ